MLLGVCYGIVWMLAQALTPAVIGAAVDAGLAARDRQALVACGGAVLALGMVQAGAGILRDRATLTGSLGAAYRTMQLITRQASALGATLPRRMSIGEVVNIGVADITHISAALDITGRAAGAVVAIVVVAAIMLAVSWQLGLVVLIGVPLMVWAVAFLLRPLHVRQQRLREQQAELTDRAVDIASGLRVLRGIGGEDVFARRYREESQRVRHAGVRVARVETVLDGARVLLPGILVAVVVWLGARYVLAGEMKVGALVAFYGYAVFLANPLRRLTDAASRIMKGYVAARRVTRVLALEPEMTSGGRAFVAEPAPLADPVSGLTVHPGQLVAVVCAAPDDAAMLADRIGRYVDSDVTYGGVPLSDLPLGGTRRRILVTTNEARLFSGAMRTELDPMDRGDAEALERAVRAASADDIVAALPDGLDTAIAEAGREFSGGQQQRLRLVRALLADPDVLVLVEPTSAVDAHTEAHIAAGLAASRAGKATVVFSTSPILLHQASRVSYVEGGKVVAEGTHGELLADARYRSVVARDEEAA